MAPVTTRAVLLRAHDYGDSSRILRFFTRDHGLVSVIARGVRGRSGRGTTTLATFASGDLTVYMKAHRDLHTMKDFVCAEVRDDLAAHMLRFAAASAAAELVLSHAEADPQPAVFDTLEAGLDGLRTVGSDALPGTALAVLWTITEAFGFAPQLDGCVRCEEALQGDEVGRFDFSAGGMRCAACSEGAAGPRVGPIARRQLDALLAGQVPDGLSHTRRHLGLVSDFIAYHVVNRPLKSLRFLGGMLPADDAEASVG
ncbi:MAG: DNA repair protein RecO [Longimicrobiales bacterium]